MATIIICIILVIIAIYAINSYHKKLTSGCCSGGDQIKKIKAQDNNKKHYANCYKMEITGMSCNNCKQRIENAFNQMHGCLMIVDFSSKQGNLYCKEDISTKTIKQQINQLGYGVNNILKTDD